MLTELDIINEMLASTGTAPLTTNDDQHPYYKKADRKLKKVSRDIQSKGWWFNAGPRTLRLNLDNEIALPSKRLHVDPQVTSKNYVIRGNRLYNVAEGTFKFDSEVVVNFVEIVDVEDLPPPAANYVQARAVYEYYRDNDGNAAKLSTYRDDRNEAWVEFKREHLKNADMNYFSGTSYAQMARRRGVIRRLPVTDA